jgi:hypothetical protein
MSARPQRRSGNLPALKVEVWAAIRAASGIIADPETPTEMRLRAVSAIATAASVYRGILEIDVQAQILAIEEAARTAGRNGAH